MKVLKVAGIILLVIIALILIFVTFMLPGIVRTKAVAKIEETTGRKTSIAGIAINPLTLTVRVDEFEIKEKDGATTFASFSSATLSAAASSLLKGRPVVDRVRLVAPYMHIIRAGGGFNFSDIQERLKEEWQEEETKENQPAEKGLTRFSIHDISLTNGTVEFFDRTAPAGTVSHAVRSIDVSIPSIDNTPGKEDDPIALQASAVVNGSPLKVTGNVRPFAEPPGALLRISLDEVEIPFYSAYLPNKIPVLVDSGTVSLGLDVAYTSRPELEPLINIAGNVTMKDLLLKERHKGPLFSLERFGVDIHSTDVMARKVSLDLLRVESFDLYVSRNRKGVWSFSRLVDSISETGGSDKVSKTGQKAPLDVRVAQTRVREGRVHFLDRSVSPEFNADIHAITVDAGEFSTAQGADAPMSISLATTKGEKATVTGSFSADPVAFVGEMAVSGIGLDDYYPYLSAYLTAPVRGEVHSSAHISFDKTKDLRVTDLDVVVNGLHAPFGGGDFARLEAVRIKNGSFSQKRYTASIEELSLTQGTVRISRTRNGKLTAWNLLKESQTPKGAGGENKRQGRELKYSVNDIAIGNLDVTFRDRSLPSPKPAEFRFHDISAGLSNLSGPNLTEMPYRLTTSYGTDGRISLSGSVRPEPLKLKTHAVVKNIALKDFAPYAAEKIDIAITDGRLDADIRADIVRKEQQLAGSYAGSMQVRSLRLQDPADRTNLLLWELLRLDDVRGTLQPLAVTADRVLLSEYYANLVVESDGTINFRRMLNERGGERSEEAKKKGKKPLEKREAAEQKPNIRIGTVTLENGVLDFKDNSLDPRRYATRFVQLGGRISGLSSEPETRADVDLRGALENQSPLRISGQMNPLVDPLYVDLRVDFDNIALPRFTPYAAKYLGYRIEQGKLRAMLDYKIEDEKIEASNRIVIDQLFFGREVESEQAINLPVSVPTAVGLLKGPKGKIELDVPVSGRTDNPEIGMGEVVWEAVKKASKSFFRKIVTNPFSFLFGDKGEEFRTIYFDYGSPVLGNGQERSLAAVAEKLAERPGLKLDVTGYVDPERDPEGYRRYLVHERMQMAKYFDRLQGPQPAPQTGHIPENVQITPEDRHEYLKRVYEQADFPKPTTAFGTLKDLPDEEMHKMLLAHTVVGEPQLRELSRLRSQAVRDFLSGTGKVDPSRLFLRIGEVTKNPEEPGKSNARVEFSLAKEKGD